MYSENYAWLYCMFQKLLYINVTHTVPDKKISICKFPEYYTNYRVDLFLMNDLNLLPLPEENLNTFKIEQKGYGKSRI